MSSRWKKVWADFWGNRTRTFLTILTIMVGTLGVGFIGNLQLYVLESMDGDYLSAHPSEAKINAYPMDDDNVRIAREIPGVNAVDGFFVSTGQLIQPNGETFLIQFTSAKDLNGLTVNTLQPAKAESGIAPLGFKEVLIDSGAAQLGYRPGDLMTVELSDGRQRELRLAGYVHAAAGFPFGYTKLVEAFVTPKTMEWLGGSTSYNMLAVSVAENPTNEEHVSQVSQAVKERLERSGLTGVTISIYQPGHHFAYQFSRAIFLIMGILGWLTVLLSSFLIINTITALMSQQTRQIGIMKATGAYTLQILAMYIILILSFGLIALTLAAPLANRAAEIVGTGMADYLGFYTVPYRGYTATLIQQIMVALVFPFLAALWPIYNSARLTVRETLTDYGIGGSEKPRKTAVSRGNLLVPRPIRLSLRNAFRRKARLSLTLFTLVLGGAIFISVMNLWGSFYKLIDELKGYYLTDITLNFTRPYRLEKVASIAESVAGVKGVEGWLEYTGMLINDKDETETQVQFVAPPSTSTLLAPIVISGRWLKAGDENALVGTNYLIDKFPDLRVGDWLTIKIDGQETKWQIVGVVSVTASGGSLGLYANYEYLSRLINQPGEVYSLRVITEDHDIAAQQRVRDQVQTIFKENGIRVGSTWLGAEEIQRITSTFDIFIYFFMVMAIMIAVIGAMGLTSTMSINVLERTREIGVMRAIGASNWNIQSIVTVEGLVIGLISWVLSILLSIPITGVLAVGVGQQLFSKPLSVVYGLNGILGWLIGILVIGTLSCVLPARNASHLTIKDTLAYEG
jgi:putative ABC transport system permease protein